jgi:hypothetical protein
MTEDTYYDAEWAYYLEHIIPLEIELYGSESVGEDTLTAAAELTGTTLDFVANEDSLYYKLDDITASR